MASRAVARSASPGGQTSSAIMTSEPMTACTSIAFSGVSMCSEPSMWLRKRAPSSSISFSLESE